MRHRLLPGVVLALLMATPASGQAQTGGAGYGRPVPRLTATSFEVAPHTLKQGEVVRFRYRIDGPQRSARVRIELLPAGARRPAARVRLGYKRAGRALSREWTAKLSPGEYVARLHAVDRDGRTLTRSATASGRSRLVVLAPPPPPPAPPPTPAPQAVGTGTFPIRGPYTWGDGFGAPRPGHSHRGQDLLAAEGTPVVSPRAGVVYWRAYQAAGAGHYVVIRGGDGRDYVFMHLKDGSITVTNGQAVAAAQPFAQVGNTGRSSGPHLHFEIWPGGWYSSPSSLPIDPAPDLRSYS